MFYIEDGAIYEKVDGGYRNVSIIGKDKVIEVRELESVTVEPSDVVVKDLKGDKTPYTLDDLVKKFNVSEKNPIPFAKVTKVTKTTKAKKE